MQIGQSAMQLGNDGLEIAFDEVFLPWPGQALLPKRMMGQVRLRPAFTVQHAVALDPSALHHWRPVMPSARVDVECRDFFGVDWLGHGYHDMNWGSRPLEADFAGWDWARGRADGGSTAILYDAALLDGQGRRLGLLFDSQGECQTFDPPERRLLKRGFWGVGGGIACADGSTPRVLRSLEDSPFYRRSLVETVLGQGEPITMMHETLDCRRLSMPLVRAMLPFRMPRRG
ncbi:carotenoid 1,2-hydratase [Rhizobium sp. AAP43]|uniref:carotenoid 1,2-hydratase n=1 Tax=Rhizobium sp. AAP43 TaxID=1523420 RepID=UPI001FD9FBB2|nr:carotenoid 1,2-hydratase [Rhizobium sp. AAP43]